MGTWWQGFRRWPGWAQALVWLGAWPVPLALLAVADPQRRKRWAALAAVSALGWVALAVGSGADPATVEAADGPTTTTTERTTTTRERIGSTTTTTEPDDLGPVPDPSVTVEGVGVDPGTSGGLSTWGAGVYSVDELLARVTVAPATSGAGYDRDLFEHWTDDDHDGCDTRAEVLQAESSIPVETTSGCAVRTGAWLSIYDGYSTPDPTELEVDHLVALHEAWVSGASAWGPERRQAFANDLGHPGALVAVTAAMNRSKSDRDPAEWQPPNRAAWCLYATDWLSVKARWQLTVDQAEATALRNMLAGCGVAPTTTTTTAPPPPPPPTTTAPKPVPAPTTTSGGGSCDPSYPGVCIPPAPPDLDCPQIPYRRFTVLAPDPHGFDGDHDGEGCESD
ncbi:MAG: HNH endonuclease family protein [Acidimicrobiales bacterium]